MATRVNPKLIDELQAFGGEDVSKCYQCGNCSATCSLSKEPHIFPRPAMRALQMGLEKKLESSLDPWLCYYCGECTEECPRGADPGETMMSLRRWLTTRYDWTGVSRMFYRWGISEIIAVFVVGALTVLGFALWGSARGDINYYDGPNAFLNMEGIHIFDLSMLGVLAVLLLSNCARMWWFTMGRDKSIHVPMSAYMRNAYQLPLHFLTQKRYADCEKKRPWAVHLVLMLSYVSMFVLIIIFLKLMQGGPAIDWRVHAFGYAATVGLIATSVYAIRGRIKKRETLYKHSHETDWIFLILLVLVALSGIFQHILHRAGLDVAANVMYLAHLGVVLPMLSLEVSFSKWSHLAYRPLAIFFAAVRADAEAASVGATKPVAVPQKIQPE
jgi:ferredoxin